MKLWLRGFAIAVALCLFLPMWTMDGYAQMDTDTISTAEDMNLKYILERESEAEYTLIVRSKEDDTLIRRTELTKWKDIEPNRIEEDEGLLRIHYSDVATLTLRNNTNDNRWDVVLWQVYPVLFDSFHFSINGQCVKCTEHKKNDEPRTVVAFGKLKDIITNNDLNIASFPETADDMLRFIDLKDFAIAISNDSGEAVPVYMDSNENSEQIAWMYAGAPVYIIEKLDGWVCVQLADMTGYIRNENVCKEEQMIHVENNIFFEECGVRTSSTLFTDSDGDSIANLSPNQLGTVYQIGFTRDGFGIIYEIQTGKMFFVYSDQLINLYAG